MNRPLKFSIPFRSRLNTFFLVSIQSQIRQNGHFFNRNRYGFSYCVKMYKYNSNLGSSCCDHWTEDWPNREHIFESWQSNRRAAKRFSNQDFEKQNIGTEPETKNSEGQNFPERCCWNSRIKSRNATKKIGVWKVWMLFWWLDRFWMHQMNSVFLCVPLVIKHLHWLRVSHSLISRKEWYQFCLSQGWATFLTRGPYPTYFW